MKESRDLGREAWDGRVEGVLETQEHGLESLATWTWDGQRVDRRVQVTKQVLWFFHLVHCVARDVAKAKRLMWCCGKEKSNQMKREVGLLRGKEDEGRGGEQKGRTQPRRKRKKGPVE